MVRAFAPTAIDGPEIDTMLDLARRAPSAGNSQAVGFVVLDTPQATEAYWAITMAGPKRGSFRWQGLFDAPVLILVTTTPARYVSRYGEADKAKTGLGASHEAWPVPYWWVDAGAVVQNLLLLVVDRGLGACLFGPFDFEPALRHEFDIADDTRIVATIALGHPLPDEPGRSAARPRAALSEILRRPAAKPAAAPPPE